MPQKPSTTPFVLSFFCSELQRPAIIITESHQMIMEEKASIRLIIGSCILSTIFSEKGRDRLLFSDILIVVTL